jgi:hypothetical protein
MNLSWVQKVIGVESMRVLQNGLFTSAVSLSISSMQLKVAKSQPMSLPQLISSAWERNF